MCHGGFGLKDHERHRLEQLTRLGFAAFAPDLYGTLPADGAEARMKLIAELAGNPLVIRGRLAAALGKLAEQTKLPLEHHAALGHCFGGFCALELARSGAAICAAVAFHGNLATTAPAQPGAVHARVLACTGADDPFCPPAQRAAFEAEMAAVGANWQHHIYGGAVHGFSVEDVATLSSRPGIAYNADADRRSWLATQQLFDEAFPASV